MEERVLRLVEEHEGVLQRHERGALRAVAGPGDVLLLLAELRAGDCHHALLLVRGPLVVQEASLRKSADNALEGALGHAQAQRLGGFRLERCLLGVQRRSAEGKGQERPLLPLLAHLFMMFMFICFICCFICCLAVFIIPLLAHLELAGGGGHHGEVPRQDSGQRGVAESEAP